MARRQARGADLRVDLELTFAEAVWGVTKEVKVARDVACTTCSGSGAAPGSKPEVCRTCGGKGQVVHSQGFFMVQSTCPHCRGRGKTIKEAVHGLPRSRHAVRDRRRSASPCRPASTTARRCASPARARPRPAARPVTSTSCCTCKATTGSSATAKTCSPRSRSASSRRRSAARSRSTRSTTTATAPTTVELKPGTQPGDVVVRRSQGIPRVGQGGRGDHVIQWKVEIPKKLSAKQHDLLRELAADLGEDVKEKRGLFGRKKS